MITVHDNGSVLETFETLQDALDTLRELWNEEATGPQTLVITNESGDMVATMIRLKDPELAMTVYPDGRTETHRCHYVFDRAGGYLSTEVTPYTELKAVDTLAGWVNLRKRS